MMEPTTIALLLVVAMIVMSFLGIHMAWTMGICALLGMYLIDGMGMVSMQFGEAAYKIVASYDLVTVPMFVILGLFVSESGLGKDVFIAARLWLGKLPGGLAIATTVANAAFGAASGSTSAAAALFSKVAYPEMKRYGYSKELAVGCITAAGTLAAMIPPSIAMVVYGIVGNQPIGKLLIAGIIPGILQTIVFIIVVLIWVRIKPSAAPLTISQEKVPLKERLIITGRVLPIMVIFFFAVAGIFFGIFTPTEGGAVGASASLITVLLMRRLSWEGFKVCLKEAAVTTGMIMLIVFGGYLFSRMLASSGLIKEVTNFLITLDVSRHILFIIIIAMLTLAGMLIVPIVMIVIFVPILLPPLVALGYDPIWFGVIFTAMIEIAVITPPVALNIFVVKAVLGKEVTMGNIVSGTLPFLVSCYVVLIILYLWPQLATWLPSVIFK
jgi:C4-dicarboxylate transporter DctM subunit